MNDEEDNDSDGTLSFIVSMVFLIWIVSIVWHHYRVNTWQLIDTNFGNPEISSSYTSEQACLNTLHAGSYSEGECGENCKKDNNLAGLYECKKTAQ